MVQVTTFPFPQSVPFSFPPLIGGEGIAGKFPPFPFWVFSGIAGIAGTLATTGFKGVSC
jgi:hypothetical protein